MNIGKLWIPIHSSVSGTVVSLISNFYDIEPNESVDLLYRYLSNNLNSLGEKQLSILNKIFQYYNSSLAEDLFEESWRKTELLNQIIKSYIENKDCYLGDEEKIANRLCWSKKYVKKFLPKFKDSDELPF